MFSGREDVPEKKGMDLWKQMSSKCSFTCICGIVLPLNPSATTVYARSAFYPNPRFTLSLQSAFYTQSAFYPWSAVRSLRWLTGPRILVLWRRIFVPWTMFHIAIVSYFDSPVICKSVRWKTQIVMMPGNAVYFGTSQSLTRIKKGA